MRFRAWLFNVEDLLESGLDDKLKCQVFGDIMQKWSKSKGSSVKTKTAKDTALGKGSAEMFFSFFVTCVFHSSISTSEIHLCQYVGGSDSDLFFIPKLKFHHYDFDLFIGLLREVLFFGDKKAIKMGMLFSKVLDRLSAKKDCRILMV